MFTLLDEQRARKFWEEEIRQESEAIGITKGEAIGITKGENRINALVAKLISMNRFDDIKRCTEDSEYRNKLYKEFNLA